MKTPATPRALRRSLLPLLLFGCAHLACAQKTPLVTNGNFALKGQGKLSTPPYTADGNGIPGFRLFNIADQSGHQLDFSGTVSRDAKGVNFIRLDVNNSYNSVARGTYGFDVFNNRIAVASGTRYSYSFDAAYISGGGNLTVVVAEFDAQGAFVGEEFVHVYSLPKTDLLFHTYTGTFAPTAGNAATVDIMFVPADSEAVTSSLGLTNLRFGPAASK